FHYDEYNYLIFFSLAFFTGMRSGELLALTWADISFSRKEIDVNKTLVKVDGKFLFTSPKTTAAKRTVSVNQKLMEDLAQWKQIQSEWLSKYFPLTREEQDKMQVMQKDPLLLHKDNVRKKYDSLFKR